jgi:hypothetical protein
MSWFGWLTKTKMEVTGLDELIAAGELITLIVVGTALWIVFVGLKQSPRKRKRSS